MHVEMMLGVDAWSSFSEFRIPMSRAFFLLKCFTPFEKEVVSWSPVKTESGDCDPFIRERERSGPEHSRDGLGGKA
jgi:hypothetical protein